MKLLGSTKGKMTKDENGENVSYLDTSEIVLRHCNVVNDSYQQNNSRVPYKFIRNKSFCQLLDFSREKCIILETFDSEFLYI